MALSGSFYTTYHSYFRLLIEWNATQSISKNSSEVTARVYLVSLTPSSNINSSASKTISLTVNGSTSSRSAANLADLNGNQKKLLHSHTVTVPHNADGTKTFSMSANFGIAVTLGSTYYSTFRTSGTGSLTQIARSSSITSSANWKAANPLTVTLNRASSSFTHTVRVKVNGKLIKTVTGVGASKTIEFTKSENTEIFEQLNQVASKPAVVEVDTFNGSTKIGTSSKSGLVTAPPATTISAPASFTVGSPISISLNRGHEEFGHLIRLRHGSNIIKTIYGIDSDSAIFTTSDIPNTLSALMPNSSSVKLNLEVAAYYGGAKIRSSTFRDITATLSGAAPVFDDRFTYKDTNPATIAATFNELYLVQNLSNLVVEIPANRRAQAQNGATMETYTAVFNGVTKIAAYSSTETVSFDFGKVNLTTDATLSVTATDSRGNKTTANKTVRMLPYRAPTMTVGLQRENNFEDTTRLSVTGGYSLMTISATNRNDIELVQYRIREAGTTDWSSWRGLAVTKSGSSFSAAEVSLSLDNTKTYNVEVKVKDRLTTKVDTKSIGSGFDLVALKVTTAEFPYFEWTANTDRDVLATAVLLNGERMYLLENPDFPASYTFDEGDLREGENEMTIWMKDDTGLNHNMNYRFNKRLDIYPETQLTATIPNGESAIEMTLKLNRTNQSSKARLYRIIGGVS